MVDDHAVGKEVVPFIFGVGKFFDFGDQRSEEVGFEIGLRALKDAGEAF